MDFVFEYRPPESSLVDAIWRTQSTSAGTFVSQAGIHWEMVIQKHEGKLHLTVRGPETKASIADCPADAEFFGIRFKLGTFMPNLPTSQLTDNEIHLDEVVDNSFYLLGTTWQFPEFENADVFVARLVREGLLVHDPVVDSALEGRMADLSLRSVQRRFLRATGMTHGTLCQIERARQALTLLEQGVSILDTVELAGYADQPHLTRSLKRYMGVTPAQILRQA